MRPYKVEHLMETPEGNPEDKFELVGILVHSGTAESGHYYSFIRERPSSSDTDPWIEFNDDAVSRWDPACMEGACFGGIDHRSALDSPNIQYDKSYSAYMLFYQRSSSLSLQKQSLMRKEMPSPIRLPIPTLLSNHIAFDNELLMRKYCLYDPTHAHFVMKMILNIKHINKGRCSESHELEKTAMIVFLNHLDQVISRTKDLSEFIPYMHEVKKFCQSCAECSRDFLEWFCNRSETIRQLLVRNPDGLVRSEMADTIVLAMGKVKTEASYAYGLGDDEDSIDSVEVDEEPEQPRLFLKVAKSITKLWDIFHTNCRAWPEYFGLLASIAHMGEHEAIGLLDFGFLRKTLEIISADPIFPITAQYSRMLTIISKRVATRPVSYEAIITLLHRLLSVCDPGIETLLDSDERLELWISDRKPVPFTDTERHILTQHWTRSQIHVLVDKLLQINQNPSATENILVILLHWPERSLDIHIYETITHGIKRGSSAIPCRPFLEAAITYCANTESMGAISNMAVHVAKVANMLDNAEGTEFLKFFKNFMNIHSSRDDISNLDLFKFSLEQIPAWAPGLLTIYDPVVRTETYDFLKEVVFTSSLGSESDIERARTWAGKRLGITCLECLHETYIRQRQQAVRSNLVSIHAVVECCAEFFDEENKDQDPSAQVFFTLRSSKHCFQINPPKSAY